MTSISEDTFVLGLRGDWALALCRITKEGDSLTFCTLRQLKLPDVSCYSRVQLKNFNRAPSGPDNPSAPSLKRHSTLPFRNSPSESILSFCVRANRRWGGIPTNFFFYVHPSALCVLAERAVTAPVSETRGLCHRLARRTFLSPKTLPITVPWENWGPETTRWIELEDLAVHQSLSGTRCAISKRLGKEVQLLDFNPVRLEHPDEEKATERENLGKLLVNSQSTIPAKKYKYFKHDIVSHLPYFEIRRGGVKGQLLIDDQWVVETWVCQLSIVNLLQSSSTSDLFFNIFQDDEFEAWVFDLSVTGHNIWMHSIEECAKSSSRARPTPPSD